MICQHLCRVGSPRRGARHCLLQSVRVWQTKDAFSASLSTSWLVACLQLPPSGETTMVTSGCSPSIAVQTLCCHSSSSSPRKQKEKMTERKNEEGKKERSGERQVQWQKKKKRKNGKTTYYTTTKKTNQLVLRGQEGLKALEWVHQNWRQR